MVTFELISWTDDYIRELATYFKGTLYVLQEKEYFLYTENESNYILPLKNVLDHRSAFITQFMAFLASHIYHAEKTHTIAAQDGRLASLCFKPDHCAMSLEQSWPTTPLKLAWASQRSVHSFLNFLKFYLRGLKRSECIMKRGKKNS